jgi:mannose-6-phosphate isomerase-like protein (cupin superfamily)
MMRGPVRIEPKGWGREIWLANNPLYCGKILEISSSKRCSLHFYKLNTESFYLRSGRLRIRIEKSGEANTIRECELVAGECMDIPPGLAHQMEAIEASELSESPLGTWKAIPTASFAETKTSPMDAN